MAVAVEEIEEQEEDYSEEAISEPCECCGDSKGKYRDHGCDSIWLCDPCFGQEHFCDEAGKAPEEGHQFLSCKEVT